MADPTMTKADQSTGSVPPDSKQDMEANQQSQSEITATTSSKMSADDITTSKQLVIYHHGDADEPVAPSYCRQILECLWTFYQRQEFLILVLLAIALAKAYPTLGAVYLAPQITASWIAVMIIFLVSGLTLRLDEFKYAIRQLWFNAFVLIFSFLAVSALTFGVSLGLVTAGILSQALSDGLVISGCMPMAINTVIVLTRSCNGDEATSIFNAAFASLIGAVVSPALISMYMGKSTSISILTVFYKLLILVVVPIVVGQVIRIKSKKALEFAKNHKKLLGKIQQYSLVFIIYASFCETFLEGLGATVEDIFVLLISVFLLLVILMVMAWYSLKLLFRDKPKLRVMGLFGCTHKTVSVGIPLIMALYSGNPSIGLYTLPLIVWHTLQLVIGTLLIARLTKFVAREEMRLGLLEDSGDSEDADGGKALASEPDGDDDAEAAEGGTGAPANGAYENAESAQNPASTLDGGVDASTSERDAEPIASSV